ncbi:MAG TPA: helix-turn-helix domain-containing protein [Nitrospirota bacterium]|nr:helix-turn-helix domain-containing protein [Nitrospirota bacterium]
MSVELLTERYSKQIAGTVSCYDRILIFGTLPRICFAEGMTSLLYQLHVRIFDYPRFAEPFRDQLRENAEKLAADHGIEIEFIRKKNFRKEDRIKEVLAKRGEQPGLVWIFSAMEPCATFKPWHDKQSGKTFLKPDQSKCLHYYFYVMDEELGLCYIRVPTWLPCRLQVYCNGHSWLALQLDRKGIAHKLIDNAFTEIGDWERAQKISDSWQARRLHWKLDEFTRRFCPIIKHFGLAYHWSIDQAEYATDVVFKRQADLAAIYDNLIRTAIHTVKPDNIATFLGHKLHGNYQDEMGNRFNIRIEGTRIKHTMGPVSIKMYDKFSLILRIETTVNDVTFFKHYREVEHRDGARETKWASMQKTIYSLPALRELLTAANRRYLEFISTIDDPRSGNGKLQKLSRPSKDNDRSFPGFNFFDPDDQLLFETIARGEYNISGLQNKDLRRHLIHKTQTQISRQLKRLRLHGLIKKIGRTYKYYLTSFGKLVITTGLKLKNLVIIPQLALTPQKS